ncbi:TIGR04222 domain-containing membrane protein [Saccharothrix saharensis]|uniref:TIGR04222 domain-containing membrane protein n=1 Tax=Saccharothrix saharensis TaxID=571190 RepID=UPI0036CE02EB
MGGPGRAAEVAVVSLVEAGAVRISRDGLVSVVGRPGQGRTPLQARVLATLPRSLGEVIFATAWSAEARSLRQHLVERGFVVPPGRRKAARLVRRLLFAAAVAGVVAAIAWELPLEVAAISVLAGVPAALVLTPWARPLTRAGKDVVERLRSVAVSPNRIALVAYYGLLGKVERHHVWEVLGIAPAAAATLRRRSRGSGSDGGASCGGGCGSCSSSSCGSSGGSDSGGSSCGGGGCGGGGGD